MKYPGIYRGVVLSANPQNLEVKCRVPSVTLQKIVTAVACVPPGWHDKDRDLLQDHVFTDKNDGDGSSGPGSHTLAHRLTTLAPRPGIEGVWVMYEEGDHEHPVWIGTYKIGAH